MVIDEKVRYNSVSMIPGTDNIVIFGGEKDVVISSHMDEQVRLAAKQTQAVKGLRSRNSHVRNGTSK